MAHAVEQLSVAAISLTTGTVIATGDRLMVRTDCAVVCAIPAISCLVAVELGDIVLIAANETGDNYVLSVLDRENPGPLTVQTAREVVVESTGAKVRIRAHRGLEIITKERFEATAKEISLKALHASIVFQRTAFVSSVLTAQVATLKAVMSTIETVAESVIENFACLLRRVTGTERVVAHNLEYRAHETLSLHGKHALLTAEELAKIDSEQIHLG